MRHLHPKRVSVGLMALIVGLLSQAADAAESLSLDAALQQALAGHPDLAVQRQQVTVAESDKVRAGFWLPANPTIQASLGRGGEEDLGMTVSQQLEVAGQRWLRLDVAELGIAQAKAELAAFQQSALAETKLAFFDVVYWQERLALAESIVGINQSLDQAAQTRLRAADISSVDATLVRLALESAKASRGDVASQLLVAIAGLNRLLGQPSGQSLHVSGLLTPAGSPPEPATALREALVNRPDLQGLALAEARLERQQTLWGREIIPNPTVSLDYGRRSDSSWDLGAPVRFNGHSLSLGLLLPLPVVDYRQPQQARTSAELQVVKARRAALEATIARDVHQALASWRLRQAPATAYADMLPKLTENLKLLQLAYKEGQVDLQRVMLAQDQLLQARTAHLDLQRQLRQAEVETERSLARLTVPAKETP